MNTDEMMKYAKTQKMMKDIEDMEVTELMKNMKILGCTYSYEELIALLSKTYNDLEVADMIFETCTIDDTTSPYPKEFIDEAILQIVSKEEFPFEHYGLISREMFTLVNADINDEEKLKQFDILFRRLFKMCKYFKIDNFDAMVYQINDGLDIGSVIIDYLDELMEAARKDNDLYKKLISFIDKFYQTFSHVNEYLHTSLDYEKAQAFISLKSKKGEQMFLSMLKSSPDKTDVVLHYALSYLDDDEQRALRIIKKYEHLLEKESDAYSIIQEIIRDAKTA